jgi:hypothetical protein
MSIKKCELKTEKKYHDNLKFDEFQQLLINKKNIDITIYKLIAFVSPFQCLLENRQNLDKNSHRKFDKFREITRKRVK